MIYKYRAMTSCQSASTLEGIWSMTAAGLTGQWWQVIAVGNWALCSSTLATPTTSTRWAWQRWPRSTSVSKSSPWGRFSSNNNLPSQWMKVNTRQEKDQQPNHNLPNLHAFITARLMGLSVSLKPYLRNSLNSWSRFSMTLFNTWTRKTTFLISSGGAVYLNVTSSLTLQLLSAIWMSSGSGLMLAKRIFTIRSMKCMIGW